MTTAASRVPELDARRARYALYERIVQAVWIFDLDQRRVHWANRAALKVWRAESMEELCGRDMAADMSESVARRLAQYQRDFQTFGASFNEQWTLYPGGVPVAMHVNFSGHRLEDGRMAMLCQGYEVSTGAPLAPDSLRSVEALLHTEVMISLFNASGQPLYRNPAARASVRGVGEGLHEHFVQADAGPMVLSALQGPQCASFTLEVNSPHGKRWHDLSVRACRDAVTGQAALLVSEVDISALKHTEAKAQHMALHDALTGLPNRAKVMQRFGDIAASFYGNGHESALIFIDLDHFKNVNDTLGHGAGDDLLVQIARRLRKAIRSADLVARLGGDEFLVLVSSPDIRNEVEHVYRRIRALVAEPVLLGGNEVRVTATLGVSLYPHDGRDIETLMRHADMAMYSAKEHGRNHLAFFEPAMGAALRERTELEADLRRAVERDEFEVHYQPRVCVARKTIVGAEALIRWRHPQRGLVRPDLFIPACESNGLIEVIGLRVFEHAARQQVRWARAGHDLTVSVNLSARQFASPELLPDMQRILERTGCDPARLEVEITETMLLGTDRRPADVLNAIRALGLAIALDDFGTGYSNLAYLRRYPIQTLKIDKTFIHGLATDRPLAELIVSMCRLMRLKIVAEGVETREQLDWVSENAIEQYQGFLFAPGLPTDQFDARLGLDAGVADADVPADGDPRATSGHVAAFGRA